MSFGDVGQQLRAYRMESGLKAEEISARLGISRAALYRYEKGEVIKLDTITKLAELLKISPLTLLGIGFEYYTKPLGYAERLRQMEETADQILQLSGPVCDLLTSERYDTILGQIIAEHAAAMGADLPAARAAAAQVMSIAQARKQTYQACKPTIIAILPSFSIQQFLADGIAPTAHVSEALRNAARKAAQDEMEQIANLMESEPLGLQLGLMTKGQPNGAFAVFRSRERASLAINPFQIDASAGTITGVAMVTNAEDAVATHQRAFEQVWPEALKGAAAAQRIRELIMAARQ